MTIYCDFCENEARATYKTLGLCAWHLIMFYLGSDYVTKRA